MDMFERCDFCKEKLDTQSRIPRLLDCQCSVCNHCCVRLMNLNGKITCRSHNRETRRDPHDLPIDVQRIIKISQQAQIVPESQNLPKCSVHTLEIADRFCYSDFIQICYKCAKFGSHNSCNVLDLESAMKKFKAENLDIMTENV